MGYTASELIKIAEAEVGYLEKETNKNLDSKTGNAGDENYTKYARDLHKAGYYQANKQGYAWCDMFVDWCFYQLCGKDAKKAQAIICQTGPYGAGCTFSMRYYKNAKRLFTSPKPGDQIFFGTSENVTHTGIVYKVDAKKVYTIEGNTSSAAGVVANGGSVRKKSYALSHRKICGYGRPKYDAETKKEEPKKASKLSVTGKWNKATTTRLQQIFGTTVDGIVSNQWACYKAKNPGLTTGWDWQEKPNGKGSALIKAMQKWAGMPANKRDGHFGPDTCRAIQKKLGTTQDGYVSNPSAMVKALQKWANKQDK